MYHFRVEDMTCGHCAGTVETAVKSVDETAKVKIDLPEHSVEIESARPAAGFVRAIEEAGYSAELQA